jgi:hypothetical protein
MKHTEKNKLNQRKEKDIGKIGKVRNILPVSDGGFGMYCGNFQF